MFISVFICQLMMFNHIMNPAISKPVLITKPVVTTIIVTILTINYHSIVVITIIILVLNYFSASCIDDASQLTLCHRFWPQSNNFLVIITTVKYDYYY